MKWKSWDGRPRSGKVLKGFAVRTDYQSYNLTARLVSEMVKRLADIGVFKSFIFTKPEYRSKFESLGYRFLAAGGSAVLLEAGLHGIDQLREYQSNSPKTAVLLGTAIPSP
jgi:[citrate (pro-3S)-lyase] ligase